MNCSRVKETCTEAYSLLSYVRKEEYQRKKVKEMDVLEKREWWVSEGP